MTGTLTTADVAERLKLTPKTVSEHAKEGKIPGAFKPFGHGWRFDEAKFEAWVASQETKDSWALPGRRGSGRR